MAEIKVLALDLDGTLTNNAKVITPRTKAALQAAADRGVRIVLASGRPDEIVHNEQVRQVYLGEHFRM